MPYVDQFDGLVRFQDAGGRMRNVRTMVVFTDGIVICPVGVDGVWLINRVLLPGFGQLGSLLLAMIRPSQRVIRSRRQRTVSKRAIRLGPEGTAAAFARTWAKSLGIMFADVTRIALTSTREGRVLVVQTASAEDGKERVYAYLNDLSAERVHEVLGPLIGARLAVPALATVTRDRRPMSRQRKCLIMPSRRLTAWPRLPAMSASTRGRVPAWMTWQQ